MRSRLQVLSISLAELVLMLFFLLLVAMAGREQVANKKMAQMKKDLQTAVAEKKACEEFVEGEYRGFQAAGSGDPDEPVLVSPPVVPGYLPPDRKKVFKDVSDKVSACWQSDAAPSPAQQNGTSERGEGNTCDPSWKQKAEQCQDETERYRQRAEDAGRIADEVIKQLKKCSDGWGYPPCWRDDQGEIQYMYDVRLEGSTLVVSRAWPEMRDQEMNSVPAARALAGRTVGLQEFLARTGEVFQDSVNRQCRHFIRVYGNKEHMNGRMFSNYRGVQDHFYHLNEVR